MSQNDYTPGDLVHMFGVFIDPDTQLAVTPSTVTGKLINPTGSTITPLTVTPGTITIAKAKRLELVPKDTPITDTVSVYTADTTAELPHGTWRYRFAGTGVRQAASEGSYLVIPTSFPS